MTKKKFRRIFVTESTQHDVRKLKKFSDEIVFVASGLEDYANLPVKILGSVDDFDYTTDAIVPIGRVVTNFLLGAAFSKFPWVTVGTYTAKEYIFEKVGLNGQTQI